MSGSKFQTLAIPGAPIVSWRDADGVEQVAYITTTWYRIIAALIQRTGGTIGRETPQEVTESLYGLFNSLTEVERSQEPFFQPSDFSPSPDPSAGTSPAFLPQDYWNEPSGPFFPEDIPPIPDYFQMPPPGPTAPPDAEGQAVGASPFTFQSPGAGFALLSGGTVTGVTWTRGASTLATGQIAGFFPLEVTDSLVITYAVLPTLTFIRRPA